MFELILNKTVYLVLINYKKNLRKFYFSEIFLLFKIIWSLFWMRQHYEQRLVYGKLRVNMRELSENKYN